PLGRCAQQPGATSSAPTDNDVALPDLRIVRRLFPINAIIPAMTDNTQLNHYLAAWNLSNPQLLTQTLTSQIYTVTHDNETVVLKVLAASETKEQMGALALRH